MTVLWITPNGGVRTELPVPSYKGYTTKKEELVKAERNVGNIVSQVGQSIIYGVDAGELIKRHIAWKYTIEVKWVGLSASEKNTIMSATGGEWFYVDFLDMDTDTIKSGHKMYRGTGQQVTGWGPFNANTGRFKYYDVSMSLIEL